MAYTEIIIVEPNTEIDTIQKALNAITTSNPVIYIKDGEYKFNGLALMSKSNTEITWIGNGINTIIKFLNPYNCTDFAYTTNFKKLRFKCDNSMPAYYGGDYIMAYFYSPNNKAVFENCLFDKSDNGLKPNNVFMFLNNSYDGTISNKFFINCTFNASNISSAIAIGNATFKNCVYNTQNLITTTSGNSIIENTFKDDINQETFEPVNYEKTSSGIYCGNDPILLPSTASEVIKEIIYEKAKDILDNYLLLTYSKENNLSNISVASLNIEETEENESTFKDVLVSSMKEVIKNNLT